MRRFPWHVPVAAATLALIVLGIRFYAHGHQETHDGFYYVQVKPDPSNVVTLRPFGYVNPSGSRVPLAAATIPGKRDETERPRQLESVKESAGNLGTGNQESHYYLRSPLPSPPNAWIQAWSSPVSQFSIDGNFLTEAPGPRVVPISPGRHVLKFTRPNEARSYCLEHAFEAGMHYLVKVDLESGEHAVEEVP